MWIDGALFGMTFVYSLESLGVQTCMLNWSEPWKKSQALRKAAVIPNDEEILFMVAMGFAGGDARFARSPRLDSGRVATFH